MVFRGVVLHEQHFILRVDRLGAGFRFLSLAMGFDWVSRHAVCDLHVEALAIFDEELMLAETHHPPVQEDGKFG